MEEEKNKYYIPEDVEEMTEKYKIDKGGICGQACLSVIEEVSIEDVLDNWSGLNMEFKGWSGWKQLKDYLEARNHNVKLKRMNNLGMFNPNYYYILRVQWMGDGEKKEKPFYGYNHWSEASAHTHFIVVHQGKFFCNEDGWFDISELEDYLSDKKVEGGIQLGGVITSAMRVIKRW